MKAFVILSALVTIISCQGFDDGVGFEPYVHDTRGDHGPYYYWKLRKQAEAKANGVEAVPEVARASAPVAPAPAPVQPQPAPRPVQQQQQQAPRRFSNFQAAPAPAVRQQQRIRAPVQQIAPAFQAPAPRPAPRTQQQSFFAAPQQQAAPAINTDPHFRGLRFQFKIAAPEFNYENNHAENAYSFSSPNYSTNAQGGSYSYNAVY